MELSEIQSKLSLTNKLERKNALQQIFRQIENNTFSQEISQSEEFWKCLKTELSDEYDSCREYTSYIIERIYKNIEDDEINHAFCTFFIGELFDKLSSKVDIEEVSKSLFTTLYGMINEKNATLFINYFDTFVAILRKYIHSTCSDILILLISMADRLMAVLPDKIHMIQEQIIINLAILVNHRHNSVRKSMVETLINYFHHPFDGLDLVIDRLFPALNVLVKDKNGVVREKASILISYLLSINERKQNDLPLIQCLTVLSTDPLPSVSEPAKTALESFCH